VVGVVAWWVQDRYAYFAVGVYCQCRGKLWFGCDVEGSRDGVGWNRLRSARTIFEGVFQCTIRMPDFTQKLHLGRTEGIVFGESEFSGEDASFEGRVFGALDQRFPGEDVIFGDGTGGYAVGRRGGEEAVFVEEAFGGYGCGHGLGPGV
jgi:hypothetical protein